MCYTHTSIDGTFFQSPQFKVSGRYFRWKITETHTKRGVWIQSIKFEQDKGGIAAKVVAPTRMEVTLASGFLSRMSEISNRWSHEMAQALEAHDKGVLATPIKESSQAVPKVRIGTHQVINETGVPVRFSPWKNYSAKCDQGMDLAPGASQCFSFPHKSAPTINNRQRPYISLPPITDIKVIYEGRENVIPSDYTPLGKDLNSGGRGARVVLCYKRSYTEDPITDIWVIFNDDRDLCCEKGESFEVDPSDLNHRGGGRCISVCYAKGTGAPIQAICATAANRREVFPRECVKIPKELNKNRENCDDNYLGFIRKPVKFVAGFDWSSDHQKGITDLHLLIKKALPQAKDKEELIRGPKDGKPSPWLSDYGA